jgi:hypothetical protein
MSNRSLGIALAGLIAAATVALAAGERIVFRPRPGLEVPYRFEMKMKGKLEAGNGAMNQEIKTALVGRFVDKVEEAAGNGDRRMSRTFTEVKDASADEEVDVTESLTDRTVSYTRDARGCLLEIAGKKPEQVTMMEMLMGMQGRQAPAWLLTHTGFVLFPYPASALRAGMEWDPSRDLVFFREQKSLAAKVKVARIETGMPSYAVLEPQLAIEFAGTMTPPNQGGPQGPGIPLQGRIELAGEQWAAVANGLIAKSMLRGKATISIGAPGTPISAKVTIPEMSNEVVYDEGAT